jgi:molybdopterin molybdotransferase
MTSWRCPLPEKRPVLSVEEALECILSAVHVLEPERVGLLQAAGRVLAESVVADRDIPPLTNSAMDGYAVRGADLDAQLPIRLQVVGEIAAGYAPGVAVAAGQAMRIMTGAPLPAGADTVVRFEDTSLDGDTVEILKAPPPGVNVRQAGEDVRVGQAVLEPGAVLRPQEIGMLAAVGHTEVAAMRRPRVAILATGDEVVPPDQPPGPGQIRDANSYAIAAQVQEAGGVPLLLGVAHDRQELVQRGIREALERQADLIITSGGVSAGDFDLVKQVLAAEGEMHFWSLNMKPGRPLAFGVVGGPPTGSGRGVPLLGLPGNPVAAMIGTDLFARPALLKMQGFTDWSRPTVVARLAQPIARKDGRRHYLRVQLRETESGYEAALTGDQGSGILSSLVQADGLAVIPEDVDHLHIGAEVEIILLRHVG